ncbi:PREDICTED: BTB/POZ domain-containing protein At4g08455-like isoform X1 [Prunus mume]|uniref:BTB/POZ domain-containing protein At4g08455-like isoform X1 n=1 Tax=Prunus mume TaxID=102107 RepID=A0ABM0N4U8_PRUMU|nr:PREDICTED: BTB/POZ domain-containing protein At4g08455-like isoform X1 [Prunus mume]
MKCKSCECSFQEFITDTCKQCDEDHKAKVAFLTATQPASFSDVVLFASDDEAAGPVPAHKAVLVSRSPVFRAMFENEMEESLSGTIKIGEVSYRTLGAFVNFLYTAEVCLDQQLAYDLFVMAEKYQVQRLKDYCQKFLVSNLNWDNSLLTYTLAHRHNAKQIIDAALTVITDNMDKLTSRKEYTKLKEKDPQLVFEIYEAFLSRHSSFSFVRMARTEPKKNIMGPFIF